MFYKPEKPLEKMPTLAQIELFLDGTYSGEGKKDFIFKSRCICNYLERALDEEGFEAAFSRINIHCTRDEDEVKVELLKSPRFLEVCIKYDLPSLSELDEASLQWHYARIIDLGLKSAESLLMTVPHGFCMDVLGRFQQGGFKNEWVQAEKEWVRSSVRSEVVARLTTEEFSLWHHVYRSGCPVATTQVVTTKPREALFFAYFGSLSMDRSGKNIAYKRDGKVLSRFNLESDQFCDLGFE